jgi:hypothetical protein
MRIIMAKRFFENARHALAIPCVVETLKHNANLASINLAHTARNAVENVAHGRNVVQENLRHGAAPHDLFEDARHEVSAVGEDLRHGFCEGMNDFING